MNTKFIKLVGVTYTNDPEDGGQDRQKLIEEIVNDQGDIVSVTLEKCSWDGEFAIKVRESKSHQVIGWIPRNMLRSKLISRQMTCSLMYYQDVWSAKLTPVQAPTSKQYRFMCIMCHKTGREMPTYDLRAYRPIFKEFREMVG